MRQAPHGDQLANAESGRQLEALGQHRHAPREVHARIAAGLATEEHQLAGVGPQGARQQPEKGGLAAAVGPDQRHQLPRGNRQVDPPQDVASRTAGKRITERQFASDRNLRVVLRRTHRGGGSDDRHDSATATRRDRTSSQMKKGAPIRAVTMPTGIPPARRAPRSASASSAAPYRKLAGSRSR